MWLSKNNDFCYRSMSITLLYKGVVFVPVSLAKGLEFDVVVVPDASEKVYGREYERHLLYVACSRALHELHLLYSGEVSPFLAQISAELYGVETEMFLC